MADLRVQNGFITDRGNSLTPVRGEESADLRGNIVLPGLVNAHTHLYSALSRGMPPPAQKPQNFLEVLDHVWWKLDRALDDDAVYYSALVGAIDAVRNGTTVVVDHHASPRAIKGSLSIIKQALDEVGLRGVLCYEVTDRGGKKERNEGLDENERFIRKNGDNSMVRGLVGAHAPFTLSQETLHLVGSLAAKLRTGVHIHVAEDRSDVTDAGENYQCSVVDRLAQNGILKRQSVLAHCVHLDGRDCSDIRRTECWVVHNPRSNMNNRVGYAPLRRLGDRVALGTDGFPADMFEEAKIAFLKRQDSAADQPIDFARLMTGGQKMVSEIFGAQFGSLTKGCVADLVVLEYDPPTPLTNENALGHVLFGMSSAMVKSVMINGKWVMNDRMLTCVDLREVSEKSRKAARKLWERIEKL